MISQCLRSANAIAANLGEGASYGEVALLISFAAFLLVIVEVTWIRRRSSLEHHLHLPLDEGQRVGHQNEAGTKGGSDDGPR